MQEACRRPPKWRHAGIRACLRGLLFLPGAAQNQTRLCIPAIPTKRCGVLRMIFPTIVSSRHRGLSAIAPDGSFPNAITHVSVRCTLAPFLQRQGGAKNESTTSGCGKDSYLSVLCRTLCNCNRTDVSDAKWNARSHGTRDLSRENCGAIRASPAVL